MRNRRKNAVIVLALSLSLAAAPAAAAAPQESETPYTDRFRYAFQTQTMPDYYDSPLVDPIPGAPRQPYESVTQSNLQGRWVNRYKEDNGNTEVEEVLTVNGDRGRIECRKNGVPYAVWNGTGGVYIEDRKDQGVCPAFTLEDYDAGRDAWVQLCGIYIRWVKDGEFYDGGSLCKWYREEPEDVRDQYLYDTVTLENLQGVWYSEYEDGAGIYQDVLNVEGNRASIFETVAGVISDTWNGEGPCEIQMAECGGIRNVPELLIHRETGPAAGGTAGIYISRVDEDRFYDAGLNRWFMRVTEDSQMEEEGGWEGNRPFTIYGGAVRQEGDVFVFSAQGDEPAELILDGTTELAHPDSLDGYQAGWTALQWASEMMKRPPEEAALSGVYDTDVTGNHIDRIYGLYWWD